MKIWLYYQITWLYKGTEQFHFIKMEFESFQLKRLFYLVGEYGMWNVVDCIVPVTDELINFPPLFYIYLV